jgi:hypothetical protein
MLSIFTLASSLSLLWRAVLVAIWHVANPCAGTAGVFYFIYTGRKKR